MLQSCALCYTYCIYSRAEFSLTMVRIRKKQEDSFNLNWNDEMHDLFINALEKQHDLGKRSDTEFKPEVWVYCATEVQNVYTGKKNYPS